MNVLRSIVVAFALYSRIPMPKVEWTDAALRYALAAFPLVGAVQGLLCYVVLAWADSNSVPAALSAGLLVALPVLLNGGIHIDGLADTHDALAAHVGREETLAVLKDPHIGSFGVLAIVCHLLLQYAAWFALLASGVYHARLLGVTFVFTLSRCASALTLLCWPKARAGGLGKSLADGAAPVASVVVLSALALASVAGLHCMFDARDVLWLLVALLVALVRYRLTALRRFGGVSGDTSGWFLQNAELYMLVMLAWVGGTLI